MGNVAKINLEVGTCQECPFVRYRKERAGWFCVHDMQKVGLEVGDGLSIPDYCPFVLKRLEAIVKIIKKASNGSEPNKWLQQIKRRQQENDPNKKFGVDHSFGHAMRVFECGFDFLEDSIQFGFSSPNVIQKQKLLLWIAAKLHDVGLADSPNNHAIHSAELAKRYLMKHDVDPEDIALITHAIGNHSNGIDTKNMLDAALIIGDKIDVTKERVVDDRERIHRELMKVEKTSYHLYGERGKAQGAELWYETSGGFNPMALAEWKNCIILPRMVAMDYLKLKEFRFVVDGKEVDYQKILKAKV